MQPISLEQAAQERLRNQAQAALPSYQDRYLDNHLPDPDNTQSSADEATVEPGFQSLIVESRLEQAQRSATGGKPVRVERLFNQALTDCCRSKSPSITCSPLRANQDARLVATVLLPLPPLLLRIAKTVMSQWVAAREWVKLWPRWSKYPPETHP